MSNSSQQPNSLDDLLTDTITITGTGKSEYSYTYDSLSMSTITLSPSIISSISTGAAGTYSIGTGTSSVTLDGYTSQFNWATNEDWVDCFPEWGRIQKMCKKYPGLEIALRNFQTVYQLVKDDYDNPTPKK